MNRKTIYICVATLTFIAGVSFASLWFFHPQFSSKSKASIAPTKSFIEVETEAANALLQPGVSFSYKGTGDGMTEAGGSYWTQDYQSSDGEWISETYGDYLSHEKAKVAFEENLRTAVKIHERGGIALGGKDVGERVISLFNVPKSERQFVSIIKLGRTTVYRIDAPSLRYALAFEKKHQ